MDLLPFAVNYFTISQRTIIFILIIIVFIKLIDPVNGLLSIKETWLNIKMRKYELNSFEKKMIEETQIKLPIQIAEIKRKQKEGHYEEIPINTAKNLIKNPKYLNRWLDQTELTRGGSVYGDRINHFYYEKILLAKRVIDFLEEKKFNQKKKKYCLLIDSGTTMYHVFCEICERTKKYKNRKVWEERVFIVTNNLPGVQYLMKNYKEEGTGKRSSIPINCLILPGKPLPVYSAATGVETCNFIENREKLESIVKDNLQIENDDEFEIISLITASYMARHAVNEDKKCYYPVSYYPVARGEGHVAIKEKFAELSDEIYLISPLTKFTFATVDCLNTINGFTIDEYNEKEPQKISEDAKENPDEVKYTEIKIENDKEKCTFFTTERQEDDMFYHFSTSLIERLREAYENDKDDKIIIADDFKLKDWLPSRNDKDYKKAELEMEIPHERLRAAYRERKDRNKIFIWDQLWITNPEKDCTGEKS